MIFSNTTPFASVLCVCSLISYHITCCWSFFISLKKKEFENSCWKALILCFVFLMLAVAWWPLVLASYASTESVSSSIPEISVLALLLCFLAEINLVPQLAMASLIESGWQYLITHFSDFQLACLGSFFLHESVFFLSGLPFIWIERAGWLSKYKIQAKINSPAAQGKCILHLVLYHVGVNLPLMIFSYPVFRYMGMQSSLPLPSWKIVLSQVIFYFILEDFVFYWGHRILHTKWLYKHVHSVHHEYATPFGLTSEYAHPAEILFLGFATIVGPAITGPHLITLWLWMVVRVLETVEAHCGYHFPWSPSNFLPLYGGADFHDYHHRLLYTKSGNYSSTFTYMDWIFGTDIGYRKLKELKNAAVEDSNEQKKQW